MLTRNARWPGPQPADRQADAAPVSSAHEPLLRAVERFLQRHDMPHATFCLGAGVHNRLIYSLRRGVALRPDTEAKVRAFIARHEGARS